MKNHEIVITLVALVALFAINDRYLKLF